MGERKQEGEIDAWKGGEERKPWRAQATTIPAVFWVLAPKRLDAARLNRHWANETSSEMERARASGTRVLAPLTSVISVILIGSKHGRGYLKISQPSPHIFHIPNSVPFGLSTFRVNSRLPLRQDRSPFVPWSPHPHHRPSSHLVVHPVVTQPCFSRVSTWSRVDEALGRRRHPLLQSRLRLL